MALSSTPAKTLRVLISGASGLIGTPLVQTLRSRGHEVHSLVRKRPTDASEHQWDPSNGHVDQDLIDYVDAVINLSGASISRIPWTSGWKKAILESRIQATKTLATAMRRSPTAPSALIQASAVGFYGHRGDEELTEQSDSGDGYLAEVTRAWEQATSELEESTTRVVYARTGLVIARGGAMAPLRLQTLLGVAGRIGKGTQWWPWISLRDEVNALVFLLEHEELSGVFNLAGPTPATATDVTTELAHQLGRPHWLGLPEFAVKWVLGEAGRELLLASQKVIPQKLRMAGFEFTHQTIDEAIREVV